MPFWFFLLCFHNLLSSFSAACLLSEVSFFFLALNFPYKYILFKNHRAPAEVDFKVAYDIEDHSFLRSI